MPADLPRSDAIRSHETPADRPWELALFYSACHLPDLVADYYAYVDELGRE